MFRYRLFKKSVRPPEAEEGACSLSVFWRSCICSAHTLLSPRLKTQTWALIFPSLHDANSTPCSEGLGRQSHEIMTWKDRVSRALVLLSPQSLPTEQLSLFLKFVQVLPLDGHIGSSLIVSIIESRLQACSACCRTGQWVETHGVRARINNLIQTSGLRRYWTSVPKNHLAWVRIRASLIREEGPLLLVLAGP